jgi:hypothetical protein
MRYRSKHATDRKMRVTFVRGLHPRGSHPRRGAPRRPQKYGPPPSILRGAGQLNRPLRRWNSAGWLLVLHVGRHQTE